MSEKYYGGEPALLRQGKDIKGWNKRTGWTITRPWFGRQEEIEEKAESEVALGNSINITPPQDGGDWRLDVIYGAEESQPTNEPLSDVWELDGNTLEKELWELPFVRDEWKSMTDDRRGNPTGDPRLASQACINWVRKSVEAFVRGDSKLTTLDPIEVSCDWANLLGYATAYGFHDLALRRLVNLYARGIKVFPVSQFVLRRTRVIADNFNRTNLKGIYDSVFKRVSSSTLRQREGIPNTIRFILPEGEWVKQTPDVKQATATKWNVTEEWWHADAWEEEIYGKLNAR